VSLSRFGSAFVALALCASCSPEPSPRVPAGAHPTAEATRAPSEEGAIRYELAVSLDLGVHELAVDASVRTKRPRTTLYLHPSLTIEDVHDERGPIAFQRHERAVELARPASSFEMRYRGRLTAEGTNDSKGLAYVDADRVRLTEVTLWYPVFYSGPESFPWPPEPATGLVRLRADAGLHWASSGIRGSPSTFVFERPSSFTLVGVPAAPVMRRFLGGKLSVEMFGDFGPSFAGQLEGFLDAHVSRLGTPHVPAMSVVLFPTPEAKNPLGFLTDSLIMLNTRFTEKLLAGEQHAVSGLAHEFAHLWFGADLRPSGPAALWLAEGFAEYYAWRALRDVQGARVYDECIASAKRLSANKPARLDALAAGDSRVYTLGPLALADLASLVGEDHLDATIHAIHDRKQPWTIEVFMSALSTHGAPSLAPFRERWGI
jgi:hypothetical protein